MFQIKTFAERVCIPVKPGSAHVAMPNWAVFGSELAEHLGWFHLHQPEIHHLWPQRGNYPGTETPCNRVCRLEALFAGASIFYSSQAPESPPPAFEQLLKISTSTCTIFNTKIHNGKHFSDRAVMWVFLHRKIRSPNWTAAKAIDGDQHVNPKVFICFTPLKSLYFSPNFIRFMSTPEK